MAPLTPYEPGRGYPAAMPVPPYHEFYSPIMRLVGDGREHSNHEIVDAMAGAFEISPADRDELLPSGKQTTLVNRTSWATTYLCVAGLLTRPRRARVAITDEGRAVLANPPTRLDNAFLRRYPSFVAFTGGRGATAVDRATGSGTANDTTPPLLPDVPTQTPDELLDAGARTLRASLVAELQAQLATCSPAFFERLVVDLLRAMGYGGTSPESGRITGRAGDGGIDGIVDEDKLGLDAVYLQAKRWADNVGRPVVQGFVGALEMHKANKGVMISTSEFTADARDYVKLIGKRVVLIGGRQLAELLIDHGVGVRTVGTYLVQKVDGDYFEEA